MGVCWRTIGRWGILDPGSRSRSAYIQLNGAAKVFLTEWCGKASLPTLIDRGDGGRACGGRSRPRWHGTHRRRSRAHTSRSHLCGRGQSGRSSRTDRLGLDHARVALVGGSSTTLSLVELLARQHAVADERVTVVYRSATQRRLAKVLTELAKGARRLVVDEYDQPDVLATIADVDVLFLGVDREQPVLRRGHVEGLRDFAARPLVVIDFNAHGSTEGLADIVGVRVVDAGELARMVDRHADRTVAEPAFEAAQRLVEERLAATASGRHSAARPGAAAPLQEGTVR